VLPRSERIAVVATATGVTVYRQGSRERALVRISGPLSDVLSNQTNVSPSETAAGPASHTFGAGHLAALEQLLQGIPSDQLRNRKLDLVLGYRLSPGLFVMTGESVLPPAVLSELTALQFQSHFGIAAPAWSIRSDQRFGRGHTLAFAMHGAWLNSLQQLAQRMDFRWASIVPSLAWVSQQKVTDLSTGWWVVDDGADVLVCRLFAGRAEHLESFPVKLRCARDLIEIIAQLIARLPATVKLSGLSNPVRWIKLYGEHFDDEGNCPELSSVELMSVESKLVELKSDSVAPELESA